MGITKSESNRKALHLVFGWLLPILVFYTPRISGSSPLVPVVVLGVLTLLSVAIEITRKRVPAVQRVFLSTFGSFLRHSERQGFTGSTYLLASSFLCSILFWRRPDVSFMALNLFILGDAAAALVGLSVGRVRIGTKTLEGSLSCFAVCIVLLFGVYPHIPSLLDGYSHGIGIARGLAIATSVTLLELYPIRVLRTLVVNDNLLVPVVTGFLLLLLGKA